MSEPALVPFAESPNARRNARDCEGGGHAPLRRRHHGELVMLASDIAQRSEEWDELSLRAAWRTIPEGIGCNDSRYSRHQARDTGRVRLAPEDERRPGKPLAQRRRERRCEYQIADVVEADEQNARGVAHMASRS